MELDGWRTDAMDREGGSEREDAVRGSRLAQPSAHSNGGLRRVISRDNSSKALDPPVKGWVLSPRVQAGVALSLIRWGPLPDHFS